MIIGPKLIRCLFDSRFNHRRVRLAILFKHIKIIEEIEFQTINKEEDKELFSYLNSCENLRILNCFLISIF